MKIYEIIQEKDRLIIILEFVEGGTLYNLVRKKKKLAEKNYAHLIKNICEALNELHKQDFVHRDLKLENIMLEFSD